MVFIVVLLTGSHNIPLYLSWDEKLHPDIGGSYKYSDSRPKRIQLWQIRI